MISFFVKKIKLPLVLVCFFLLIPQVSAQIITLENGDRLTAPIEKENASAIWVLHPSLGKLEIGRDQIKSIASEKPPASLERQKGQTAWERRIAAGYGAASGNSDFQRFNSDFLINRNRMWIDEWTLKGSGSLEESNGDLTVQKAAASVRYAYSIREKIYNFYRLPFEHDLFENLQARITPSTGLGYWLADSKSLKLLSEGGIGYQMEYYRPEGSESDIVLHARGMFSKKISDRLEIGLDTYYFPLLRDFSNYRIEAEAFARILLSEKFSIKLKAEDQYRTRPKQSRKKNDLLFTSALEFSF